MKIGEAIVALQAVNAIMYDKEKERSLPFKLKYNLYKIKEVLSKEAETYEKERVRLIEEMGEDVTKEDGTKTKEIVDEEKKKEFFKKIDDVMMTDVLADVPKVKEKDLKAIEDIDIDITELQIRSFFSNLVEMKK